MQHLAPMMRKNEEQGTIAAAATATTAAIEAATGGFGSRDRLVCAAPLCCGAWQTSATPRHGYAAAGVAVARQVLSWSCARVPRVIDYMLEDHV